MAEYKIRDIEQLTGIKAHTIRIWEKRYNLLAPARTDTQIRTYSDAELLQLLNVATLNKRGVKISRIAGMNAREIAEKVREMVQLPGPDAHIEQLIIALLQMDEALFRSTLGELIAEHGVRDAYQFYIIKFLERIGVMWQVGSINPAQEHFISNLVRQRIISEIEALPTPDQNQPKALLFLPEHEWHELALLLYQYHLRSCGLSTVYLGQALPYSSLLEAVDVVRPKWLLTSWLTSVEETHILHYFTRLKEELPDVVILAGGHQVKEHYETIKHLVTGFHSLAALDTLMRQQ